MARSWTLLPSQVVPISASDELRWKGRISSPMGAGLFSILLNSASDTLSACGCPRGVNSGASVALATALKVCVETTLMA